MAERIDHAVEARAHAKTAANLASRPGGVRPEQASYFLEQAKVHATLALVEQQRIANLISLMQMQEEIDENTELLAGEAMHALIEYERTPATPFSDPDDVPVIRAEIRKGLGL